MKLKVSQPAVVVDGYSVSKLVVLTDCFLDRVLEDIHVA